MNVALTNATLPSPSIKGDPTSAAATTTRAVPGPDVGNDLLSAVDAATDETFGQMLSRGLTELGEAGSGKPGPLSPSLEPGIPKRPSLDLRPQDTPVARTDPAERSRGFGVAVTDLLDTAAGTAGATKPVDDGTGDAPVISDGGRHDDAAANDLAAQLALVSQWAGIAKTPAPQVAGAADGLAIQDKLATVRGTALSTTTASTARAALPEVKARVADQPQDAPSLPFAAAASRQAFVKDERAVDVAATPTARTKTDPTPVRTVDTALRAVEHAAAGEPGTVLPLTETSVAPVNAFVQQIAAATSAIAAPPTDVATVPTWNIHEQVGTPAWSREVGQATLRIATSDLQTASLQINPEHLGPVDVQVRIDNGIAHLSFNAAHADTRQAIESSRATLDRLFSDQGLKIGDCAVGDSSTPRRNTDADAALAGQSQRNGNGSGGGRWDGTGRGDGTGEPGMTTTVTTRLKALGLVDTFA